MAVVIETTLGDITVDLYLDQRPVTCLNFLKLCKMKYYNFNLFHTIRNGFIAQTGDPSGEGSGGKSIWGILEGPHKRFFSGEKMPKIRHTDAGLLSMVCTDDMMVGSQFFFTLAPDLNSLDGTHCVIGEVTEGHDVLTKLNEVICDESHRPYRDVRITHTVVLEDPFNDPSGIRAPSRSPSPSAERLKGGRIAPDEEIDEAQGKSAEEIQEMIEEKEAKARATILEIVGDLPDAEIAPPENVLFVCKLNPVTTDEDLEIIFSRFGKIVSCEVIRDKKTGNSLQYAFIEFDNKKSCEDAYFKMDNVLIDDRRIHVDFSQSVSKMRWLGKGRGVQYFDDDSKKMPQRDEVRGRYKDQRAEYTNNRRHYENDRNGDEKHREDNRHRQDRDRENYRDHKERERARDWDHKNRKREKNRDHRERSRSRSKVSNNKRHENRQDRSKSSKGSNKHRDNIEVRESSHRYDNSRNNHQNDLRSKSSPNRNDRNDLQESSSRTNRDISETKNRSQGYKKYHENNSSIHSSHDESKFNKSDKESKREKHNATRDKQLEPKTPSPKTKKEKKTSSKTDKISKQKHGDKNSKKKDRKSRKRKHSTSSSLSSSESSSSTDSSSSDSDRKKRKTGRKKRKHSTSSSSSDTSSSSTSSSDSSSESSSSSDSSQEKRKHKTKIGKKNKKKL